jgi:putative hydrolase of the HAD superfamily
MITTVVFDLDDTLYDEIEYCKSGFRAVAAHLSEMQQNRSNEQIYNILWVIFQAGNRTKTFDAALEKLKIPYDGKIIGELINIYRNHKPDISLPPDSREVLDTLKKQYTLALLTDGFLPAQQLKVQALGITNYFKCIIYTEELGREYWKPSPAGFEKLLEILQSAPEQTIYVADNEKKDFIAPNKLKLDTVRIIRPLSLHKYESDKPEEKARHIIHEINRLPDLLEGL